MKSGNITSVFNIPEIEDQQIDYRKLYEKEKRMRLFYERKTQELQKKIKKQFTDLPHPHHSHKGKHAHEMMEDIKSFKSILPYSVKMLPPGGTDRSIDSQTAPPLIQEWAIYGLNELDLTLESKSSNLQPSILACNSQPSQILEHTARLVFPSGTYARSLEGKQAQESSLDIINLSKEKMKTFILSFQPTSIQQNSQKMAQSQDKTLEIINQLNPERRIFAICLQLDQFTIIRDGNHMIQLKTARTKKPAKSVKFQQFMSTRQTDQLLSVVTKRIYVIFSYYPFFAFFQQLLKSLLSSVKVQRYIKYKQGGQNLKIVDSQSHCQLMKKALGNLKAQSTGKTIVTDKLLDFQVCGNNKAYLQLSKQALTYNMAEEWAYYVLSLFTLDVFLDVLTLMTLQQKMVFVCPNATILTHTVYLFTKVLIKPFQYPYPVVTLIPDQQQYLNAPFPVVYGYLKTKQQIIESKLSKKYKNVYVFFQPSGVEIECEQDKHKILNKKSPRLRDRLISKFKKMRKNYPSTFFSFIKKKTEQFEYPVNVPLARQIITQVCNFMLQDIYELLPDDETVQAIKKELVSSKKIEEDEINRQTFMIIKDEYGSKSKDPFFSAFMETQLLNVHLFKY